MKQEKINGGLHSDNLCFYSFMAAHVTLLSYANLDHQLAHGYFETLPANLHFSNEARLIRLFFFWLYWILSTVLKIHGYLKSTSVTSGDNEMGNSVRTAEDSRWQIPGMKFALPDL